MNDHDAKAELIEAGLQDYRAAREALAEFESLISGLAKQALDQRWPDLRTALTCSDDQSRPTEDAPWMFQACGLVGACMPKPVAGVWYIGLGIRWPEEKPNAAVVCLLVAVGTAKQKESIANALRGSEATDVRVETTRRPPHTIQLLVALEPNAGAAGIGDGFARLVSTFVDRIMRVGGLRGLVT